MKSQIIPLVDLRRQHAALRKELTAAIASVLEGGSFMHGENVPAFEEAYARFCGVRHAVGVASGTAALELALRACEIGPGAEVITAPNSFFATAEAIANAGARPVFVDVSRYGTMDVTLVERAITSRTRAIIPVHLYGQPCDMDPILDIARRHHLTVIEDCAQAHGARYKGRPVGSIGHVGCFSFFPTKNLGACGEAGAVTTGHETIARRVSLLRAHGENPKNRHTAIGYNHRLDELQAAILLTKLRHLEMWNERRRAVAQEYRDQLHGVALEVPQDHPDTTPVFHLFVIRLDQRDALARCLKEQGVGTGVHYPTPIHLQPACSYLGYQTGSFPNTERRAVSILSLPMFPELSKGEIQYVTTAIKKCLSRW